MGSRVVWSTSIVWTWLTSVAGEDASVVDVNSFLTFPPWVTVSDGNEVSDNRRVSGKGGVLLGSFARPAKMPLSWSR